MHTVTYIEKIMTYTQQLCITKEGKQHCAVYPLRKFLSGLSDKKVIK